MSLETARRVLRIEAEALGEMMQRLDARFEQAVEILLACKGRVVVTGMGKSGLIGRKIAATFSSTGTPAAFLHPAEAIHGDLGMLMRDDVVLAVSYGGETEEIIALLETIKRLGLRMVTLTGHPRSTIAAAVPAESNSRPPCDAEQQPVRSSPPRTAGSGGSLRRVFSRSRKWPAPSTQAASDPLANRPPISARLASSIALAPSWVPWR